MEEMRETIGLREARFPRILGTLHSKDHALNAGNEK
jgi:hypothetical protein